MSKTLQGLRILDLTRVLAGPFCTMILADLGAEVLKIEPSGAGDDSRSFGPFMNGESTYFMSLNRNKKGITLNLRHKEGKAILKQLVKQADVLVENYRPGTMKKLELEYPVLAAENPRLIYAAISGFGQEGPFKQKPAYDFIVQGMGGIMSLNAHPGGAPTRVPIGLGDITAALYATIGILAAVQERERSGRGQMIDVSMLDCQIAILENPIIRFFAGDIPKPIGNTHPTISPAGGFPTKDGYMIITVGNDNHWKMFCRAFQREEWITDSRFVTNAKRTENMPQLRELIEELLCKRSTGHWVEILEKMGIPCGPVHSIEEVVNDPNVASREMIVSLKHPVAGDVKMSGMPIKLSRTPGEISVPPPMLGQHNAEILKTLLGFTDEKINDLKSMGVL
jgi:CoA:oxalate CoA-transferase